MAGRGAQRVGLTVGMTEPGTARHFARRPTIPRGHQMSSILSGPPSFCPDLHRGAVSCAGSIRSDTKSSHLSLSSKSRILFCVSVQASVHLTAAVASTFWYCIRTGTHETANNSGGIKIQWGALAGSIRRTGLRLPRLLRWASAKCFTGCRMC